MSVFNEGQIREAIESFQKSHPIGFGIDIAHIDSLESLEAMKNEIDGYIRKAEKDSEIYIICEMAKQYLNGARPSYELRNEGEWIMIWEDAPQGLDVFAPSYCYEGCSVCKAVRHSLHKNYCGNCGSKMKHKGEE